MYAYPEAIVQFPDQQTLARCRAGDVDAFERIYAEYRDVVLRHALYMVGHEEDARDIRQETFLKAFQSLVSFRGESSMKTWLLRICTNLCLNRARTLSRRREVGFDSNMVETMSGHNHAEDGDPARRIERAERARMVWKALDSVRLADRQLIVMRDIEDLSYAEIAEIVGCSRAALSVRLARARSALKKSVQAALYEEI